MVALIEVPVFTGTLTTAFIFIQINKVALVWP
jgi:hypothetical protein